MSAGQFAFQGLTSNSSITSLVDVSTNAPANGDVLIWNNGVAQWVPGPQGGGGANALNDLTDVTLTPPLVNNQLLKYNSITSQWENSGIDLNEILDVDLSLATENDSLKLNSASLWVNRYEPRVMGNTPNNVQFRTQFTGNVPASGEVMFLDALDVNVGSSYNLAVKVRLSDKDVNGAGHVYNLIHSVEYPLILNRLPQNNATALGVVSFYVTGPPVGALGYVQYGLNMGFQANPPINGEYVSLSYDTKLEDRVAHHLTNPSWCEIYLSPSYVQAVANFNTYVKIPSSLSNRSSEFSDDGLGNITYNGIWGITAKVTLSVCAFANIQDTRLSFVVGQNGNRLPDEVRCINYSKNSILHGESSTSFSHMMTIVPNDVISIHCAYIEDNSPSPNPTQITIENIRVTIHQVSY